MAVLPTPFARAMSSSLESPFTYLFTTNYVPSDAEIEEIQMDLALRAQELARLDERIRELSTQRDQIQAYVDSHKALLSLPRRLPPDIVREIFMACLSTTRNAVMSAREAPLVLCWICSGWRTIALSTPRLWASLHVPLDFILAKESRIMAVTPWLQRSAACPISLSVSDSDENWTSSRRTALMDALALSSTRWRHVDFRHLWAEARHLVESTAPQLESFKFSGRVSVFTDGQPNIFKTPSLRSVTIFPREPLDERILAMPLLWEQLTHLTLESDRGMSLANIITLLGRCTRLVSFRVTYCRFHGEIYPTWEPLSLPFLESLAMTTRRVAPQPLTRLIEHVSMPQLHDLFVVPEPSRGPESFFLVPLGTRSPLLENLTIWLSSLTRQSLPETLRSLPSLTKLTVFDGLPWDSAWSHSDLDPGFEPTETTQLLELLTPADLETAICPSLQELVLRYCERLEKSVLDAFIEGRMEFTQKFRRLEIDLEHLISAQTELVSDAEIQSNLLRGLDISLNGGRSSRVSKPIASPWTGLDYEEWR